MHLFQSVLLSQTLQVQSLITVDIKQQDEGIVQEIRDGVKYFTELTAFSCDTLNFLFIMLFFQPKYHKVASTGIFTV